MSKKKNNTPRNCAVLVFVLTLVFFGAEVFAVCTAKNQYDYDRAKLSAEELSVELGLISSAFHSGNKKLYEDTILRYQESLADFTHNEYAHNRQAVLINSLRDYGDKLRREQPEIAEFLELSAALSGIRSELQLSDAEKLDAVNFYHLQETFQHLRDTLDETKSEHLAPVKAPLDSFAAEIISLAENSAVCISVCPKDSFANKRAQLDEIKAKYEEQFSSIGKTVSEKYDPSSLIQQLNQI